MSVRQIAVTAVAVIVGMYLYENFVRGRLA